MYRKYITDIKNWLDNPNRKPLIIWGARQVGKTYLIKDIFAETYFKNKYIYVDCKKNYSFNSFCENHNNPKDIINYLSVDNNTSIDDNTLLIFDEVQECLPIVSMMKYFCQDFRKMPVIITGSMVQIKLKRKVRNKSFLFPIGKINELTIYPLNFEEFLINKNKSLYDSIVTAYKEKRTPDDYIHTLALDSFYDYLLVGGMPEALNIYLETGSYQKAREVIKELYNNYLSDMSIYQASPESIIRSRKVFENIYAELNKESKNFSPSNIEAKARNRDMQSPIDWLTTTFIVNKSSIVKEVATLPLIQDNESIFRLYLVDMGIFSYESGNSNAKNFLSNEGRNTLSGIFFENYVSIEIINAGFKLFYWKGKNDAEMEFLIEDQGYIVPIDVKKNRGSLNSLSKFKQHNKFKYAVKISSSKYGFDEENKILSIPFYEVFLYFNEIKENNK